MSRCFQKSLITSLRNEKVTAPGTRGSSLPSGHCSVTIASSASAHPGVGSFRAWCMKTPTCIRDTQELGPSAPAPPTRSAWAGFQLYPEARQEAEQGYWETSGSRAFSHPAHQGQDSRTGSRALKQAHPVGRHPAAKPEMGVRITHRGCAWGLYM